MTISSIQMGGTDANNFALDIGSCGTTLAPLTSCDLKITYTPEAAGTNTAVLSITSGPNSNSQTIQTINLGGNGTL